jgi:hypothetical protein
VTFCGESWDYRFRRKQASRFGGKCRPLLLTMQSMAGHTAAAECNTPKSGSKAIKLAKGSVYAHSVKGSRRFLNTLPIKGRAAAMLQ